MPKKSQAAWNLSDLVYDYPVTIRHSCFLPEFKTVVALNQGQAIVDGLKNGRLLYSDFIFCHKYSAKQTLISNLFILRGITRKFDNLERK